MSTIFSVHQPNYLPWLGYFHKMSFSDIFVFLDSVQYTSRTYTNRAFVMQGGRETRLSVPVKVRNSAALISEGAVDTAEFADKHLESLRHAYGKCSHYERIVELLRPHYEVGQTSLAEFNMGLIKTIAGFLGLAPRFLTLSELSIESKKNQMMIDIAKACGADIYVSGLGARNYIQGNEQLYAAAGVTLAYQNFAHPRYRQREEPFVPMCSVLDLLFNEGDEAGEILTSQPQPPFDVWRG